MQDKHPLGQNHLKYYNMFEDITKAAEEEKEFAKANLNKNIMNNLLLMKKKNNMQEEDLITKR